MASMLLLVKIAPRVFRTELSPDFTTDVLEKKNTLPKLCVHLRIGLNTVNFDDEEPRRPAKSLQARRPPPPTPRAHTASFASAEPPAAAATPGGGSALALSAPRRDMG